MRKHYVTIMGSRAYGAFKENSDYDFYGIFTDLDATKLNMQTFIPEYDKLPSYRHVVEEVVHFPEKREVTYYSLPKFFNLAAGNNPNILDSLFTPIVSRVIVDDVGDYILKNRTVFLSQVLGRRYLKYAEREKEQAAEHEIGSDKYYKKFYHSIRLLSYSKQLLTQSHLDMQDHEDLLGQVRLGELDPPELEMLYFGEAGAIQASFATSPLPEHPDRDKIRAVLRKSLDIAGFTFY